MPAVLLVSDDDLLVRLVDVSLSHAGYDVLAVSSIQDAIRAPLTGAVRVAILDASMPLDTLEPIAAGMRTGFGGTPLKLVFVVSARARAASLPVDPETDQLLVKPLSPEAIRKAVEDLMIKAKGELSDKLIIGEFEIDRGEHTFGTGDGEEVVELSQREFELLDYLAMRPGEVVQTSELVANVWYRDPTQDDGSIVRSQVQLLRRKLKRILGDVQLIESFPRRGYRLNPDVHRLRASS